MMCIYCHCWIMYYYIKEVDREGHISFTSIYSVINDYVRDDCDWSGGNCSSRFASLPHRPHF